MKQTIKIGKQYIRTDFGLIFILLLMLATSCFALYNATNMMMYGSGNRYLARQLMWYSISFIVMFAITKMQNKVLFQYIDDIYKVLLGVLIYLMASKLLHALTGIYLPLARDINGAYSWLSIPIIGSFQASEFMKIVLIIKVSQIIAKYQKRFPNPTFKEDCRMFSEILRWCALPMLLVLAQPDTGVFVIMALTLMIIVMCSGIKRIYVYLIFGLVVLILGLFILLFTKFPNLLSSLVSAYQINRIEAWLHPEDYIQGSSNQLYTALLSLGSAGLTGHGMLANVIAIPEAQTDFIFAAFGQCFGLFGTLYIVALCLLLDLYLCRMAFNVTNRADKLIIIGAIAMLFYQQFQNMGMILGLIPITGITLPLISYGGSSTLSYFILFGVIMNLSPASKKPLKFQIPEFGIDKKFRAPDFRKKFENRSS